MPHLILHEHPSQRGTCLASMVRFAQRIPLRFSTLEETAVYLRSQPFEADPGIVESAVPVPDYKFSACEPWQRERVWPSAFNCWEATAHWLAHALKLLKGSEVVEIWDRTLPTGGRHVWPTLERDDGIWLVQVEGNAKAFRRRWPQAANAGWEDVFGFLHLAGKETLGLFLGNDRAAPIVQMSEKAWGSHIADWSKGPSVLGTSIGEPVREEIKKESATERKADKGDKAEKKKESINETPKPAAKDSPSKDTAKTGAKMPESKSTDSKTIAQPAPTPTPERRAGMDWEDV